MSTCIVSLTGVRAFRASISSFPRTPNSLMATQPTQENVEEKTTEVLARSVDLQFSYDGVPCLKDITLEVPAGARVILIGSNGAGKSTLLRLLRLGTTRVIASE